MVGVMFDSNVFDAIIDGKISLDLIQKSKERGFEYFITHVQTDEIADIPDSKKDKRKLMILFLTSVKPGVIPTETFVLDHSRLDFGKLGDAKVYKKLVKNDNSNMNDALIGETAIKNNYILVTDDIELRNKVNSLGGKAKSIQDFTELIKGDSEYE